MFTETTNIIRAEKVGKRVHNVTIFVHTRPESRTQYLKFYNKIAERFCADYKCKFDGNLDVELSHFNEGAIVSFDVKEYKKPESKRNNKH